MSEWNAETPQWYADKYGEYATNRLGVEALELADLQDWYRRWYAPNNATLVVVGDVRPEAVREMAE